MLQAIFEGGLARIVLDRDLRNLERFLTTPTIDWKAQAFGFTGISILDLALGWQEGLQALSAVWTCDASYTFWLAFSLSEMDSCLQILDLFFMPMNTWTFIRLMMELINAGALDWTRIVVKSHVRKRTELAGLGRRHLSLSDQRKLGVSHPEAALLDAHARDVYDQLRKKGIHVPWALHPGWGGSIYCILGSFSNKQYGNHQWYQLRFVHANHSLWVRESFSLIEVAQELFDNGFTNIDTPQMLNTRSDRSVATPLQRATLNFAGVAGLPLCLWLLQKGASPNFPLEVHNEYHPDNCGCPKQTSHNLLTRLATACGSQSNSHWSLIRLLVQYVSGLSPPMSRDSCVCYCHASGGYLPPHSHVNVFEYYRENCNRHEHMANSLVSWIEACHLIDDKKSLYFEQAVRLELFDRLGLVHTCCLALRNQYSNPPEPEEVDRIRGDNEELGSQLDLLIQAYRGSLLMFLQRWEHVSEEYSTEFDCGCYGNTPPVWGLHNLDIHTTRLLAHWRHWWTRMDPILTDIYAITIEEVEKACAEKNAFDTDTYHYFHDSEHADILRAMADMRTVEKLVELGYADLDYKEVIEEHFKKELSYARENINPVSGEDGHYWEKNFDEADFVPVHRPELLDELMERLTRGVSGQDEMWTKEIKMRSN